MIQPISVFRHSFPLVASDGKPRETPGWTHHDPLESDGLVFESNGGGKYGRVYHVAYVTSGGVYVRDGMLRAERGGVVDVVVDERGRFGLQKRERPQTRLSFEEWQQDFDHNFMNWDAIGRITWECPRGYGEKFKDLAETAKAEAEEETGFKVIYQHLSHTVNDNTASVAHMTGVYETSLDLRTPSGVTDPDHEKALSGLTFFTPQELLGMIQDGELYCSFTLATMTPRLLSRVKHLEEEMGHLEEENAMLMQRIRDMETQLANFRLTGD